MGEHDKTTLSSHAKKSIGAIMTIAVGAVLVAILMNLHVTHTHPDSSREEFKTLSQEVSEFKERSIEERVKINSLEGKLENYEDALLRLTTAVQSMERKMEALIFDYGRFKDDLTKTLIEVIRAQ